MSDNRAMRGMGFADTDTGPNVDKLRQQLASAKNAHADWGPRAAEMTADERAAALCAAVEEGEIMDVNYEAWALEMCTLLDAIELAAKRDDRDSVLDLVAGRLPKRPGYLSRATE